MAYDNVQKLRTPEEISMEAISEGHALNELNRHLRELVADILDRRKKLAVKRKLRIDIIITPTRDRSIDEVEVQFIATKAPYSPKDPARWADGL